MVEVEILNPAKRHNCSDYIEAVKTAGKQAYLFIGSPVYRD